MRIGLLTGEFPPLEGGVGNYTDILSRRLFTQGHQVFVFSDSRAEQQNDAIPVQCLEGKWRWNSVQQVRQWAQANQLDVLNLQYQTAAFNMSPIIHFLPQLLQTPLVTTFHDLRVPYLFPKAGPLRHWIVMHLAHVSDGVIASDPQDFARLRDLPLAKLIPIGSNIPADLPEGYERQVLRKQAGLNVDEYLLGFFGFINHSKGYDTLLNALRNLLDEGIAVRLVQIGGKLGTADPTNAAYAAQLDALTSELSLSDHIYSTGFVDAHEVSAYLAACDLVVLPYRDGASQRRGSLMAAVAQGCAIVTTYPEGDSLYFTDDKLSLVPPDDDRALTTAIADLLTDSQQRRLLHESAKALQQYFDWDVIAQQIATVYQAAIEAQP